jgi:tetratricopeptide (TPR) repeat protein
MKPPQALYESAQTMHRQGRLAEAERLYRGVLEGIPGHLGTLQRLGEICFRTGRIAEAADLTKQALETAPDDAQMLSNLGFMLTTIGRSGEALGFLERSLALRPDAAQTHANLGNALAALNRPEEALQSYAKAAALAPNLAEPHNNIGNVFASLKRQEEAVAAFEKALAIQPSFAEAWSNLGNSLFRLRRTTQAIACFRRALALKPEFAPAHYNWGTLLGETGLHDEAVEHYRLACAIDPRHTAARNNLGRSLNALGRPEEALAAFEEALAIDPGFALAQAGIGSAMLYLGRVEEARAACERAVATASELPAVHRALAEVKHFVKDDPEIAALETLAEREAAMDDADKAELHFALAKAYADCADHARAFAHMTKGNAAKRRLIAYDEEAHLGEMRRTAATFTRELMQRMNGGEPSQRPVFIVGMPRSGTTLIEQILASHPLVFGAGEQPEFGRCVLGSYQPGPPPFDISALAASELRQMGACYLGRMEAKVPQEAWRFTDKMPANFRFLGLIHLSLPGARVIHVHRDPLDTCFSCYSKLFTGNLDYTYDLGELGRYYKAYAALMAHWRAVLPEGVMLEVCYEDLVGDFEAGARKIVAHCGLDWDERCLEFHKTERAVITASTSQVRQPLFKTSIGRWQPYAAWLAPLREAMAEVAP